MMNLARTIPIFVAVAGLVALAAGPGFAQRADTDDLRSKVKDLKEGLLKRDLHSYGSLSEIRVKDVKLILDVDFKRKALTGAVELTVERMPGCPPEAPLILDTKGLDIISVRTIEGANQSRGLPFLLGRESAILGSPLWINLPPGVDQVEIWYSTTDRSSALQWLDANGTAGGKQPFLFTQSQAIHARSWIPIQDSPGIRVRYKGYIRVPNGLTAVMSAECVEKGVKSAEGEKTSFRFEMNDPIPPYLIALAVGDLTFKALGPRTGVYAEPSVVDLAAREFVDTEKMVETAEKRFGPYRWGRYDILVLPPSFPYGGMENARLTFATPTVLAGDRSLVSLIAHELAHSWSGNLVTNATWRDFWLNEGFTTYLEQRIVEDLYGPDRADMERVLGMKDLRSEIARLPPSDQILHIDLTKRDPDEGMTKIPYEKGALFLVTLEKAVGREKFDAFLREYFDHFAFKSITTDDFVAYLKVKLLDHDATAAKAIDLHAWLSEPGLPNDAPEPNSERLARVEQAARDWESGKTPAVNLATANWSTHEWIHFLQSLPKRLDAERLAELDKAFGLTTRGNAEVAQQWLVVAVRNRYAPADARLESFLTTIGRRKYLMPLYDELLKTPEGAIRARAIYAKARSFYHPIAVESVDKLMKAKQE